jgi:guanine deaminase
MAASAPISRTIYLGTVVHSISLSKLEIGEAGAIAVDENGIIKFVEKNVEGLEQVAEKYPEWKEAQVVRIPGNGFYFPGFIGMLHSV